MSTFCAYRDRWPSCRCPSRSMSACDPWRRTCRRRAPRSPVVAVDRRRTVGWRDCRRVTSDRRSCAAAGSARARRRVGREGRLAVTAVTGADAGVVVVERVAERPGLDDRLGERQLGRTCRPCPPPCRAGRGRRSAGLRRGGTSHWRASNQASISSAVSSRRPSPGSRPPGRAASSGARSAPRAPPWRLSRRSFCCCCSARSASRLLAARIELHRELRQFTRSSCRRSASPTPRTSPRGDVLHVFDVDHHGLRRVGVTVDVRSTRSHDLLEPVHVGRVASSCCCVAAISVASTARRWVVCATWPLSWTSIAWFWLTWLANAANASASGLAVVVLAGAARSTAARWWTGRCGGRRRRGGGRRLLGVSGGRGARNTVTSAPATSARARGIALYRRPPADC